MRSIRRLFSGAVILTFVSGFCRADSLKTVAENLEKAAAHLANKKIAVLSFPYHDGKTSSGSSIIQERLTTFLAQNKQLEVIERRLLEKLLQEKKLAMTGVIDEKTTQEVGKVLGVGAVVTGTLIDLGKKGTEVNARLIETATGKIAAADQARIETAWTDRPVSPSLGTTDPRPSVVRPGWKVDPRGKALVQMAILLDTSNSMDGLIEQAKSQLWRVVNDMAYATRGGEHPDLQVALYEYGNDILSSGENYVRQVLPFTTDLDRVSEKLFALRTQGGSEYCGAVIKDAVNGLAWDARDSVYKVMFIAGNEPFTQGSVPYRESIAQAVRKGILVNPIFCGAYAEGVQTEWYNGAVAGGGAYLNIDQNVAIVAVPTPYDAEIQTLGQQISQTYVGYGTQGRQAIERRKGVDQLAALQAASGALTERSIYLAAPQSSNVVWDAVSGVASGRMDPAKMKKSELPRELQDKSAKDLEVYFKDQQHKRQSLQARLTELNRSREAFLDQKQRGQAAGAPLSLDQAMRKTIRQQAGKLNFTFTPSGS